MAEEQEKKGQGRGWYGDSQRHAEAGRKGGEKVLQERGPGFFEEIGSHQGKENNPGNFANDPERAAEAGRLGGKKRGQNLEQNEID